MVCDFCHKNFKRECYYLNHKCKFMERVELFKKPLGQTAYLIFNQWRKICKYPSVTVDTFVKSKYFNSFINYTKFTQQQSVPDKMGYIELMVEKGIMPYSWCDSDVYDFYIENFDNEYTIDQKIDVSITTLQELSRKHDCEIGKIFERISPIQVIKYITSRKLSPWLLLPSEKFMHFITYKTNKEERMLFRSFVNISVWKQHFIDNPEKLIEIKEINRQLGI